MIKTIFISKMLVKCIFWGIHQFMNQLIKIDIIKLQNRIYSNFNNPQNFNKCIQLYDPNAILSNFLFRKFLLRFDNQAHIMKAYMKYDSYCTNQECLKQSKPFFNFSQDNHHILQHQDRVYSIHPRELTKLLGPSRLNDKFTEEYEDEISHMAREYAYYACQVIVGEVERIYRGFFMQEMQEKLMFEKENGIAAIIKKLEGGDLDCLQKMLEYFNRSPRQNFSDFLVLNQLKDMKYGLKQSLKILNQGLVKSIYASKGKNSTFLNSFSQSEQKVTMKQSPQKICSQQSIKEQVIEIQQNFKQIGQLKQSKRPQRSKLISKPSKNIKKQPPFMKLTRNIQAITLENHMIQQIAPLRIHVYSCNDAELTFEYLSRTYQDIECLHIFCTQFAKKNIIAKIFQRFRNLKEISFNCNHQFREEHIANLPLTQLKKIQKLELKWSSDTFFNEFYRYHYFQSKEWNSLQRQNEVKISLDTLDKLQRNCTIWIPNQTVAKEIKRQKKSFRNITILHLADLMAPLVNIGHLCDFYELNNLTTLNLKSVSFTGIENKFSKVIASNPNLQTILIYQCTNITDANQTLKCLRHLPKLTQFNFVPRDSTVTLQVSTITDLIHLRSLYLTAIEFKYGFYRQNNFQSLIKLTKLQNIGLYCCEQVTSQLLMNLSNQAVENMVTLCMGNTKVDNNIFRTLLRMKKLKYLGLDETFVTSKGLLNYCKDFFRINGFKCDLRYLSIQQSEQADFLGRHFYKKEDFMQMGQYLPNLEYLYAFNCDKLMKYDFKEYGRLRVLAADEEFCSSFGDAPKKFQTFVVV